MTLSPALVAGLFFGWWNDNEVVIAAKFFCRTGREF
jgi:hypothetical protein